MSNEGRAKDRFGEGKQKISSPSKLEMLEGPLCDAIAAWCVTTDQHIRVIVTDRWDPRLNKVGLGLGLELGSGLSRSRNAGGVSEEWFEIN